MPSDVEDGWSASKLESEPQELQEPHEAVDEGWESDASEAGSQSPSVPALSMQVNPSVESCRWWSDHVKDAMPKPDVETRPLVFESACAGWCSELFMFKV